MPTWEQNLQTKTCGLQLRAFTLRTPGDHPGSSARFLIAIAPVPEAIGIIAARIPGGALIDPLGQEVTERVVDIGRMPLVLHSRGKAFGEANLAINAPEQEGSKVGRQGPAFKIGSDGIASEGRKT
jgi:hypothetical protein